MPASAQVPKYSFPLAFIRDARLLPVAVDPEEVVVDVAVVRIVVVPPALVVDFWH